MRLLLLLFVVLFAKTESLSLGSFFNGLLGFSSDSDSQLIGIPSKSEGLINGTTEIFLNETIKSNNNSLTTTLHPEEYEYQDVETTTLSNTVMSLEGTTVETLETPLQTIESNTVTEVVALETVITESTPEVTIQSDSESTLIPKTELGDFVDINRDNFIDEGSGEEISKGISFLIIFIIE
uniref:Uncharacterized protein n=1 Tax=Panagrolaimus davidi TaxID=227884 RepID=A0A914PU95_9BILA